MKTQKEVTNITVKQYKKIIDALKKKIKDEDINLPKLGFTRMFNHRIQKKPTNLQLITYLELVNKLEQEGIDMSEFKMVII